MNLRFLNSRKLINIIEMASQLILQIYHRDNFGIEIKEDKSPLTEAATPTSQSYPKKIKMKDMKIGPNTSSLGSSTHLTEQKSSFAEMANSL